MLTLKRCDTDFACKNLDINTFTAVCIYATGNNALEIGSIDIKNTKNDMDSDAYIFVKEKKDWNPAELCCQTDYGLMEVNIIQI